MLRQGDILVVPASHPSYRKPSGKLSAVSAGVPGRHVLAYGEVTGHHHSVDARTGTLALDEGGVMYLTIEELTAIEHQEHGALTLEPGEYMIRRQREWSDENEPRQVAD